MNRIVIPVDGSDGAAAATRFGARLARDSGASLILLHVYDATTAAALGFEALTHEEMEKTRRYVAQGSFDAAQRAMGESVVPVETYVAIGYPGHEIVTFAETSGADLIVMGNRGLSTVRGLLLGSVSDYVVHHAKCPVTVVHGYD